MIVLSALGAASLAAGCGDDGDGSGGDVTTGIAPSTQLADVTTEQLASACPRLKAGFDRVFQADKLIRAVCTLSGVATTETTAECVTYRDQGIQQASMAGSEEMEGLGDIEFTCDDAAENDHVECTGTVGQLETCFNDTLDRVEAMFNQFSCDDAATLDEEAFDDFGGMLGEPPASCEAVGCPGESPFAPDDSETGP